MNANLCRCSWNGALIFTLCCLDNNISDCDWRLVESIGRSFLYANISISTQLLFDDLFTDLMFLCVDPFSTVFVGMIVFYLVRDVIRDPGYGWKLIDCIEEGMKKISRS